MLKNVLVSSIMDGALRNISSSIPLDLLKQSSAFGVSLGKKSKEVFDDLYNHITGKVDYQRYMDSLEKQMAYNSAEAEKNRQFQEYMSNTSYQRQMDDLKKAGINPMLVINSGGASSPSGAYASVNNAYNGNSGATVMAGLTLGVNSATSILNQSIRSITQIASSAMSLYGSLARTVASYGSY